VNYACNECGTGGAAQVFWIAPLLRKWGIVWYSVGLGGIIAFIAILVITRIPDNFITCRGGRISDNGIIVETFQIAFVALIIAILVISKKSKNIEESKINKQN